MMVKYEARYKIEADYWECGTFFPDEPRYREYLFEADSDMEAWKKAKDHLPEMGNNLFHPRISLESLQEVRRLSEELPRSYQLELNFSFNSK